MAKKSTHTKSRPEHKPPRRSPRKTRTPEEKKRRRRKRRIILLSIIGALVIFRFFLPSIVLHYLNNKLANLTEYYGHIEDIDIHLYRGAYVINDVKILRKQEKAGKTDTIPFFKVEKVDLSIQWSELFQGAVVGKVELDKPVLNFVKNAHKNEDIKSDTNDLKKLIDGLLPFTINQLKIHDGEIHVIDPYSSPRFDISMNKVEALARNISNVRNSGDSLPASLRATAVTYGGKFKLDTRFNADAAKPTFDLNLQLVNLELKALNPFFKAYGDFDVERGNFSLYTELAAKNGQFGGYVKPIADHLKIATWKKSEGNVLQITWETVLGIVSNIFKNQREQQIATEIPFSGTTDNPEIGVIPTILNALRNAFILHYKHELDNSVNIDNRSGQGAIGFMGNLFHKDKDKKKHKKKS